MNPMNKVAQVRISSPLLSGLLYSFVIMIASTVVLSFLLMMDWVKEDSLTTYIYAIHSLSTAIGGFISGKRADHRGWYHGGLMGVVYSIIIFLIGFLGFDASLTLQSLILAVVAFAVGALGGMLGVNMKK